MFDPLNEAAAAPKPDPLSGMPASPDEGGPNPIAGTTNASPAAAPAPKQPSMWKQILAGALTGMADGFGANTVAGGAHRAAQGAQQRRDSAMEQQKLDADIRFRDMQSAANAATATRQAAEMERENEKMQMARDEHAQKLVEFNRKLGVEYDAIPNTGDAAMQYLKQAATNDPGGAGVPSGIVVSPSMIYVPKQGTADTQYSRMSKLAPLFGLQVPDKGVFLGMKPDQQSRVLTPMNNIIQGHGADGTPLKAESLRKQVSYLESSLAAYKNKPERDKAVEEQGQSTLDLLKKQMAEDKAGAMEKERGQIRVREASQNARPKDVIDAETGNVVVKRADQAIAAGDAPAAQGQKAMAQATQLQEMQVASRNLRGVINKLQPFSATQIAQIKAALSEPEGLTSAAFTAKFANQQLTPQQQEFVVWAGQMQERAMALRSASGIGQQGSDKLRSAIVATLPNERDTPELMKRKLNAFDNQVSILMRGIPGVGRGGKNKTQQVAPQPQNSDPLGIL